MGSSPGPVAVRSDSVEAGRRSAATSGGPDPAEAPSVTVVELAGPGRLGWSRRVIDPTAATVDVEAVGICGTDRHVLSGAVPVPQGTVTGHEIIGRIGRVPDDADVVADWPVALGDRVAMAPGVSCRTCYSCLRRGMYCERRQLYGLGTDGPGPHGGMSPVVQLWPGTRVFRLPEGLPTERAVFVEPLACSVRAVAGALPVTGPLAGHPVCVLGFGPIGLTVAVVALSHGAQVRVVEPDPRRRALAQDLGFAAFGDADEAAGPRADRRGPVLAVECAGVPSAFTAAARAVRLGGTVVEMGSFAVGGAAEVDPSEICRRDLRIVGTSETCDVDFHAAIELAISSPVDMARAVTHRHAWHDLADPNDLFATRDAVKQIIVMKGEA